MSSKTVQLSTRVTDEDAAFLARLKVPGAKTPSDKLRAIICDARRRYESREDYGTSVRLSQDLLAPSQQRLREVEHASQLHSELASSLADWLAESMAFFMAQVPDTNAKDVAERLQVFEGGILDRIMRLFELVLRMGVTPLAPCYDRQAVSRRLSPVLELCEIIATVRDRSQTTREQKGS